MNINAKVCVGDIEFNPVVNDLIFTTTFYRKAAMLVSTAHGKHYVFKLLLLFLLEQFSHSVLSKLKPTSSFIYIPRVNDEPPAVCVSNIAILLWSFGKMVLSVHGFAQIVVLLSFQCVCDALVISQAFPQVSSYSLYCLYHDLFD